MVGNLGRPQETNQIYGIDSYDEFRPVLEQIKSACHAVAVGADTAITEYGRGQFEINLMHCDDPVRACDEAALLRHLARRVARQHGVDVTFMGKPFAEDTGSGFHLHASLWNKAGTNLLREPEGGQPWDHPQMAFAAGGMARYLGESMAVSPQCQCLAADTARPLRADRPQLGLQQPDGDVPHSAGRCQGKAA